MNSTLKIAVPQIAPVWMNRDATLKKCIEVIKEAAKENCDLVVFGEGFAPGYPFWVDGTGGAEFNSPKQKEIFAYYSDQAIQIESGHLDEVCAVLNQYSMACYLGIIERAQDRSGHSLYCTFVYIDRTGTIQSTHRKLQPTYEERLVWSQGDGAGLVTHKLGMFTAGGLNCWENWMPLTRAALYAQGEDLHIACWPGNLRNTKDLTPMLAKEGRSYCVSVASLMRDSDVPDEMPFATEIKSALGAMPANGGSCIAAPDGSWILAPEAGVENLRYAEIEAAVVREERQNFDPAGHYSRPDVTKLVVNRERQSIAEFND